MFSRALQPTDEDGSGMGITGVDDHTIDINAGLTLVEWMPEGLINPEFCKEMEYESSIIQNNEVQGNPNPNPNLAF